VLALKVMNALVAGTLRPDLGAVRADCPPALVALVQRCWDSAPRKRPAMREVVAELERIVAAGAAGGEGGAGDAAAALPGQAGAV
jgi:hypothetical protein